MQIRFFSIPVSGESSLVDDLNRFLRTHRVISVQKEITQRETAPCWRICVEYLDSPSPSDKNQSRKRSRIDYKQILSEEDFAVFSRIRELRKKLAEKEAVPVYAICTNEQLAKMATECCSNLSQLKEINGFGEGKAKKYGNAFLDEISGVKKNGADYEKNGQADR